MSKFINLAVYTPSLASYHKLNDIAQSLPLKVSPLSGADNWFVVSFIKGTDELTARRIGLAIYQGGAEVVKLLTEEVIFSPETTP